MSILASLGYGWRLTKKHTFSLVAGTVAFYLTEVAGLAGWRVPDSWHLGVTLYKTAVACWLLWHAMELSDRETRASRLHEATMPSPGYLGRFLSSAALFWGLLAVGLWPSVRLLTGVWHPGALAGAVAWLWKPWAWSGEQAVHALQAAVVALPAGWWAVYGWFHGYYVADEGQGAVQSMVSSTKAVRHAFWPVTLFLLVIGALNAVGLALWVVGIFAAFPITLMATTYVHLELKQQTPELAAPARSKTRRRRP